jgi:AraC family transcriptional regulator
MERAKIYLAAGEESVTEVAFHCGYENPAHFAAAFRRWVGVSPLEGKQSVIPVVPALT